jgi:hypothetical protein
MRAWEGSPRYRKKLMKTLMNPRGLKAYEHNF